MVRLVIIGAVIAVAFILYALVDAAMSDASRARGVSKPVWVVLVVVLPVVGAVLWFTIGKGRGAPAPTPKAPDDDPRFTGTRMSDDELDEHMRDLEARLRELDAETFPGETPPGQPAAHDAAPPLKPPAETLPPRTEPQPPLNPGADELPPTGDAPERK